MFPRISKRRFLTINIVIALAFPVLICRILQLVIQDSELLTEYADKQQKIMIKVPPQRGTIFDRNMRELATNLKVPSIAANPRMVAKKDRPKLAKLLAHYLELDPNFIMERLRRDKAFVWIKRFIAFLRPNK